MEKQQRLKKIRNILVLLTAVSVLVYIGIEPYLQKRVANLSYFHLALFAVCLAVLAVVFVYNSKYGKNEHFYEEEQLRKEDAPFYLTSREEQDLPSYIGAVCGDLAYMGYKVEKALQVKDLPCEASAYKNGEFLYIVSVDHLETTDVTAYLDAVMHDVTAVNLKRKGECVLLFVCHSAEEDALHRAKEITRVYTSRNNALVFSTPVLVLPQKRVYFLGNRISKAQKMIVHFVMNCDFPLKEQYIGKAES